MDSRHPPEARKLDALMVFLRSLRRNVPFLGNERLFVDNSWVFDSNLSISEGFVPYLGKDPDNCKEAVKIPHPSIVL